MFTKLRYWLYRLQFNHPELFNHRPIHLDLELARACNLKCPFCYRQAKGFSEKFPPRIMSSIEACNYLIDYYKAGFRSVKFNWRGEPLLHSRIGWLARRARELGYLDRMINTSLTVDNDDFINHLHEFTEIRVSLDTMDSKLYSEMRPPAKLETVLDNLADIIKRNNYKTTKIIVQRRTTERTESDDMFSALLFAELESRKAPSGGMRIISKPAQPRVSTKMQYPGGPAFNVSYESSYFSQWQSGLIERQYCKQPSQRVVVGVDGKEWSCCLAYDEPHGLLRADSRYLLISRLLNKQNYLRQRSGDSCEEPYIPHECYRCTSFSAYKEK